MTDKVQLIKEEIERRIEQCYKTLSQDLLERERNEINCCLQQYKEILQFIDSLPEELASKDLEEAANQHSKKGFHGLLVEDNITAFKAGAEWKGKKDQETIELAEDHAMLAGMNKMKEEMMENAVDGQIYREYIGEDGISNAFGIEAYLDEHNPKHNKLHDGDKVKIIIVKEEQ